MRAREALLSSSVIPGDLRPLYPICTPEASDSASFDEVLGLLHLAGRSVPHVVMMMPEAWENDTTMCPGRRTFYRFHLSFMEAWDGPPSRTSSTGMSPLCDARWCSDRDASLVMWAITEGLSAAHAVDVYLTGASDLPSPVHPTAVRLQFSEMEKVAWDD